MAKRQTRRSISVKGQTYARLKDYCDAIDSSLSGYLEELLTERMDAAGVPIPTQPLRAYPLPAAPVTSEDLAAQPPANFTF